MEAKSFPESDVQLLIKQLIFCCYARAGLPPGIYEPIIYEGVHISYYEKQFFVQTLS
jgi:hypothetical protein